MAAKLKEIAEAAGVSVPTASRALTNSTHPMNAETRERIIAVARKMGYQPNLVARSLRTERTNTVGLIVENILSPFIPPIIRGIEDILKTQGFFSTIINSDWDEEIEAEAINSLNNRKIDGIIFIETWHRSAKAIQEKTDKPFVFVHRLFHSQKENTIRVDEIYGARLATGHLAKLGHKKIAFINGPKDWDASVKRLKGYHQELDAWKIPCRDEYIRYGDWEVGGGYQATQSIIALPDRPTAIFAANDLMALGAIYAIQEAGLRVPEDIAVVGYDDRNFAGIVRPALTTVTLPAEEMGEEAAKLLLNLIKHRQKKETGLEVRGKLIVRQSCGAQEYKPVFEEEQGSRAWRSKRRRADIFKDEEAQSERRKKTKKPDVTE